MNNSLMLMANSMENKRTECFFEIEDELLDFVSGAGTPIIKCASGEYSLTYHCAPDCGPAQIDCA